MLRFSEFWMLVCTAHFGIDIGLWWAKRIGYSDIGVGGWIGGLAGLAFGILVMMPLANSDVRKNLRRLTKKALMILWEIVGVILGGFLFLAAGVVHGVLTTLFTNNLLVNVIASVTSAIIAYIIMLVITGFGCLFKKLTTI